MLQCVAGIILYVLLEGQDSFVDFWCALSFVRLMALRSPRVLCSMKNLPTTTPEDCMARWSRNWVVVLAVRFVQLADSPVLPDRLVLQPRARLPHCARLSGLPLHPCVQLREPKVPLTFLTIRFFRRNRRQ